MSMSIIFALLIAILVGKGQHEQCGVFPKDPIIRMGSNTQIMFKAPYGSLCTNIPSYDPSKIFWVLNHKRISERFYSIFNSTVSVVSIQNFTLPTGTVTCNIDVDGNSVALGGTTIKALSPPVKPTNISCITILKKSFTCYWDSGNSPFLDTVYTVVREQYSFGEKTFARQDNCTSTNSSCTFEKPMMMLLRISVTAVNAVGNETSDFLSLNPFKTVKISPPENVVMDSSFQRLKVKWERPLNLNIYHSFVLVCEVLYQYQKRGSNIKLVKTVAMNTSAMEGVSDIKPEEMCTNYTAAVRCALENALWSDWSRNITELSYLDVDQIPLRLWRKIDLPDRRGNRRVLLMWKGIPPACNAIDGYRITLSSLQGSSSQNRTMLFNASDLMTSIVLGNGTYIISIVAYQKEDSFSRDSIVVPSLEEVLSPVGAVRAFAHNGQIHVTWIPPPHPVDHYMVDWSTSAHGHNWRESQATNISLDAKPFIMYRITVSPLYDKWPGQESSVLAYLEEGAPGKISSVSVSDVTDTSARVTWTAVARDECCGFVVNYTVFYETEKGRSSSITVNSTFQEVNLEGLEPHTKYTFHVTASSVAGGTNSYQVVFTTHRYDPTWLAAVGFAMICLPPVLLFCSIMVKKHVFRLVPNPRLSTVVLWPNQDCQKSPPSLRLLIPALDSSFDKLEIYPPALRCSVDGIVNELVEDYVTEPPTRQPNSALDCGGSASDRPMEARTLGQVSHVCPTATSYILEAQTLGENCAGKRECLDDKQTPGACKEMQPFLEMPRNLEQAYVTMGMFGQGQVMGM